MNSNDKWDNNFLEMARGISLWSKDPSIKIGVVAVKNRRVLATGYNGFPRNMADDPAKYLDRQIKTKYVVHGEMNTIYNAAYNGISLCEAELYVWGLPVCSECAKGIIQAGICRIICPVQDIPERWIESSKFAADMLTECGVRYDYIPV